MGQYVGYPSIVDKAVVTVPRCSKEDDSVISRMLLLLNTVTVKG